VPQAWSPCATNPELSPRQSNYCCQNSPAHSTKKSARMPTTSIATSLTGRTISAVAFLFDDQYSDESAAGLDLNRLSQLVTAFMLVLDNATDSR
jgi:hypothetical protein